MSVTRSARKNRLSSKSTRHQAIAAISAATSLVAWAAVSKADTFGFNDSASTLNTSTAWTDETVPSVDVAPPGANDTAQFDSLAGLTSTTTLTLGQNTTWGGLTVLNPDAAIVIGNTTGDNTNTLTLGSTNLAGGINMSAATQNLTIVDPIAMAINQSFLVNTSQTLTLNGSVGISTATLTFGGGGMQIVNGAISDGGAGGALAETGSGTVILSNSSNSFTGNVTLSSGVMQLNFSSANNSNILPSAAELRLGGGTLTINGYSGGGSQTFSSAAANGPTFVTPGLSTINVVNNGTAPTVAMGTMLVNQISTNTGGQVEFIGPATSTDGLGATLVPASANISVGSTQVNASAGNILVDTSTATTTSAQPFAVVGQPGNPNDVTDFAAVSGGVVVGGSTIAGFYTEAPVTSGEGSGENYDISGDGEFRISSSRTYVSLRFNTPTGGLFDSDGNTMDQILIKNGSVLQPGAILVTPNVGANNIAIQDEDAGSYLDPATPGMEPYSNTDDINIFQYNTQGALIINTGFRDGAHTGGGYAQAGPGTVELNGIGTAAHITTGINLNGGLTILGNFAQGAAFGDGSSINLNGGNIDADYTSTIAFDVASGTPRPFTVLANGGSISATTGNAATVDGVISGAGVLSIGYGGIATNEANNTTGTITQNLPSAPNTAGNGTVILTATNTYSGGTNVNYGTLQIDTGTAGTGPIAVAASAQLAGNAQLTNAVTVKSGGNFTPGDPISLGPTVGTLGVGTTLLNAGSISNFAFNSVTSYSQSSVTGNFTAANGWKINPVASGSENPWTISGTYDIFTVTGTVSLGTPVFSSNAATYSVAEAPDPSVPGDTFIELIVQGVTPETWNTSGGGSWATAADWYPSGVPNAVGAIAIFNPTVGNTGNANNGGTITLDGNETVGTIDFENTNSEVINSGNPATSVLHIEAVGTASGAIVVSGGSHTINSPVSLDSNTAVTVTSASSTLTFGGAVEGADAMTINPTGHGEVILAANNTYAGATAIEGGTLQVGTGGANGSLGTSATPVTNLGALVMDTSSNQSISVGPTAPTGTGSLTQAGTGTLDLTGTNNASVVTISHGEIQLATGATLTTTGDVTNSGLLDLNGNNATFGGLAGAGNVDNVTAGGTPTLSFGSDGNSNTFSGLILNTSGTVSLVKAGNGTETLSGLSTFSGGTTITSGAVLVTQASGTSSGIGSGTVTVDASNGLQLGNGVTLSNPITDDAGSAEFEDVPTGSATLTGPITTTSGQQFRVGTISATATVTLTGAETGTNYIIVTRGNVVVNGGSLTTTYVTDPILIGRQSPTNTLNLTFENGGQLTGADGIDLGSGTAADDDASIAMTVQSGSSVNAGGPFNLNDDANASQVTAAGYSYPVNLTLAGGSSLTTTAFQSTSIASTNTGFVISGGSSIIASGADTLVGTGPAQTGAIFMPETTNTSGLLDTAQVFVSIGSGGAIFNNGGFSITIGETLADGGSGSADTVTYTGTGTTVIANSNSYGGNTTISAGTVVIANASGSATSSGTVTVTGGILASASPSRITLLQGGTQTAGVAVGAYLDNAGAGVITGPVVVGSAGTIAPGEVGAGNFGTMSLSGLTTVASSTIDFDLNTGTGAAPTSATGDELLLTGTATIGSGTDLTFDGTGTIGDYYRIMGGSAISGRTAAVAADFVLPPGYTLNTSIDPGFIDVLVVAAGPASLTWDNASSNNLWDTATSSNWNNGSANTVFHAQDNVTFNDNNPSDTAANYAVTLNSLVSPGSVTVNNTTGNYTISGVGGSIGGTGALTKSGTDTLTLSTPNTYTGGTTVTAGKLLIEPTTPTSSALPHGALGISGSGIVQLADNVTAGTVLGTSNVNLTSLSISGNGTLDLGNNRIILDYTAGHDPIASIQQWIENGFLSNDVPGDPHSGGGPSIISSDIAADDAASGLSYGIGYADGADSVVAGLPSGEIEIMLTLLGDANLDGTVNTEDFTPFSNHLGQSGQMWDDGDFNYDGTVNTEDFTVFSHNLGESDSLAAAAGVLQPANTTISLADVPEATNGVTVANVPEAGSGISLSNVPEPTSTGLLTVGLVSVLARRRRKAKA